MPEQLWVSKRDMTLGDRSVNVGELIRPTGGVNDLIIFGDNTRWVSRYDPLIGMEPILCDTDGCNRYFATLGHLQRHRQSVHAKERDERERRRLIAERQMKEAEERGETIGGHPIVSQHRGPGGMVDYVDVTA